ncbi:MAG: hypothetical protein IJW69_01850, partial [Clostridia bacterium]|nr:hypothetical protein [Clostridia bacterium]
GAKNQNDLEIPYNKALADFIVKNAAKVFEGFLGVGEEQIGVCEANLRLWCKTNLFTEVAKQTRLFIKKFP